MKMKITKQSSLLDCGITKTSRSSETGADSTEFSSKTINSESTRKVKNPRKRTVLKWKKEYHWLVFDVENEDETKLLP